MSDKDWMLNPTAVKAARACIVIVQEELDIKLKLSHPQFIEMLKEYVELTESEELESAYNNLVDFAGNESLKVNLSKPQSNVSHIHTSPPVVQPTTTEEDDDELVIFKGKAYKRFMSGKEFRGLYRGQARYA